MSIYSSSLSSQIGSPYASSNNSSLHSLRMSDLSGSQNQFRNNNLDSGFYGNSYHGSDFSHQISACNREIDASRFEIQELMAKVHAYSKNSGLGDMKTELSRTPTRYGDSALPRTAKFDSTPVHDGDFFHSSINYPV